MTYLDSALGELAWYRRWRGGKWHVEFVPDFGGWSTGFEIWTREEDQ